MKKTKAKVVKSFPMHFVIIMIILAILAILWKLNSPNFFSFANTDAGDINKDGVLNTSDIAQLRTAIVNNTDLGGIPKLGDINEDGIVDVTDVMLLKRAIVDEVKVGTTDRTDLKVGDYVDYTPDTVSNYSKDKLAESISGSANNTADIKQDNLKWQILRKYDDGSMDLIGSATSQIINFGGAIGYNNGVYLMNDICKSLYSKTSVGIEARSVNLEDYEYWLTDAGKAARDASYGYGTTRTFTGANSHKPDIYGKTENVSDSYYATPTSNTYSGGGASDTLTAKNNIWDVSVTEANFGEGYKPLRGTKNSDGTYGHTWLASRSVDVDKDESTSPAIFGFYEGRSGIYFAGKYNSDGHGYDEMNHALSPVIKIPATTKISVSSTAGEADGKPHKITQYETPFKTGTYVKYNVPYTDSITGHEFTTEEGRGWRILDSGTDNGNGTYSNVKIISTGLPVSLYYIHTGMATSSWKATSEQIANYKAKFYASTADTNSNMLAATGLYYNFGKIIFNQGTPTINNNNTGYFTKVNGKTSGTLAETEFITGNAKEVHNLTMYELNQARNKRAGSTVYGLNDTDANAKVNITTSNDAGLGLFKLNDLNNYGYVSGENRIYWLSSPGSNSDNLMWCVATGIGEGIFDDSFGIPAGLRPVITLTSMSKSDIIPN